MLGEALKSPPSSSQSHTLLCCAASSALPERYILTTASSRDRDVVACSSNMQKRTLYHIRAINVYIPKPACSGTKVRHSADTWYGDLLSQAMRAIILHQKPAKHPIALKHQKLLTIGWTSFRSNHRLLDSLQTAAD
jgi:hypothetical protein